VVVRDLRTGLQEPVRQDRLEDTIKSRMHG
jgi:hypothetical protein